MPCRRLHSPCCACAQALCAAPHCLAVGVKGRSSSAWRQLALRPVRSPEKDKASGSTWGF